MENNFDKFFDATKPVTGPIMEHAWNIADTFQGKVHPHPNPDLKNIVDGIKPLIDPSNNPIFIAIGELGKLVKEININDIMPAGLAKPKFQTHQELQTLIDNADNADNAIINNAKIDNLKIADKLLKLARKTKSK